MANYNSRPIDFYMEENVEPEPVFIINIITIIYNISPDNNEDLDDLYN